MTFTAPLVLLFIPVLFLPFIILGKRSSGGAFLFPSKSAIQYVGSPLKIIMVKVLPYLRLLSLVLLIIAFAGPQIKRSDPIRKAGIGVIVAIDCSSSMLAGDLKIDFETLAKEKLPKGTKSLSRLDAVKIVAKDFIAERADNLAGVVAFSAEAFVVCPLTFQHEWVESSIDRLEVGLIKDGTAIGSAIMSSVGALKDIEARSRIVVLLTDGINNFGSIPPLVAAEAARTLGIKIYTVGIVNSASGLTQTDESSGRKIYTGSEIDVDEPEMRKIAGMTGGEYFRAEDMRTLRESYAEIDRMEKTVIERGDYEDNLDIFEYFLHAALAFLFLEILLSHTLLRKIP